jgi:hypothetical protein
LRLQKCFLLVAELRLLTQKKVARAHLCISVALCKITGILMETDAHLTAGRVHAFCSVLPFFSMYSLLPIIPLNVYMYTPNNAHQEQYEEKVAHEEEEPSRICSDSRNQIKM